MSDDTAMDRGLAHIVTIPTILFARLGAAWFIGSRHLGLSLSLVQWWIAGCLVLMLNYQGREALRRHREGQKTTTPAGDVLRATGMSLSFYLFAIGLIELTAWVFSAGAYQ